MQIRARGVWALAGVAMGLFGRTHVDPKGFRVEVPDGWQVRSFDNGTVTVMTANAAKFVTLMPVLGRTKDCGALLRGALQGGWDTFPGAAQVQVDPAARGAVARFAFDQGRRRGAVLCAETSARTAMIYGMGAPVGEFARDQALMAGVLKSFQYGGGGTGSSGGGSSMAMPRMAPWRERNEGAFTIPVPEGWQVQGGIQRLSNTDVRGGIRVWSPDGVSLVQFNDVRLEKVLVMGRTPMPAAQMGPGWRIGAHQSGLQMAEWYLRQVWASELGLSGLEVIARQDRPDLGAAADRIPLQYGVRGFQHLFGEISFRATRQGRPVEGRLLGMTRMLWSPNPDLMGGNYETEIKGVMGAAGTVGTLARIGSAMEAGCQYDFQWVMANRRAAAADVQRTLDQMRASAQMQQQAFWDRMAASDARREGVNDVLGGRVRLTDGQGNQYEAKAGSNYYFYDVEAGRRAGRPNDAVVGGDVYPSPVVDLRPLEVIR